MSHLVLQLSAAASVRMGRHPARCCLAPARLCGMSRMFRMDAWLVVSYHSMTAHCGERKSRD